MGRKEDLERMRQMIDSAEVDKKKKADDQRIAELNIRAKEFQRKKESEVKLRATGIVELFEAVRDEGIVKFDKDQGFQKGLMVMQELKYMMMGGGL